MGILRRLREWREDADGTLIGPNIDAESVDAGSVNADETTIGGTDTVSTGPIGDTGDLVPLETIVLTKDRPQTTSTSFEPILPFQETIAFDDPAYGLDNVNFYGFSFRGELRNDTADETTTARILDSQGNTPLTTTEIEVTGTSKVKNSAIEQYQDTDGYRFQIEMKVTGGTGEIRRTPHLIIWGQKK